MIAAAAPVLEKPRATIDLWPFRPLMNAGVVPLLAGFCMLNTLIAWIGLKPAQSYALLAAARGGKLTTPLAQEAVVLFSAVATLAAALLAPIVTWCAQAGLVKLAGHFVDPEVRFNRVLSLAIVTGGVPAAASDLLRAIVSLFHDPADYFRIQTGLALFAPGASRSSLLYFAFAQTDPLRLWGLALLALGLARLYRRRAWVCAALVFGFWLLRGLVVRLALPG